VADVVGCQRPQVETRNCQRDGDYEAGVGRWLLRWRWLIVFRGLEKGVVGPGLVRHLLDVERMVAEADEGAQGHDFVSFVLALSLEGCVFVANSWVVSRCLVCVGELVLAGSVG